jgi:hypothetical protein
MERSGESPRWDTIEDIRGSAGDARPLVFSPTTTEPMFRFLSAALAAAAFSLTAPSLADELIRQANDQESLILGVSRLTVGLQSVDKAHTQILNQTSGPEIEIGYANTRMRSFLGLSDFYTRWDVGFGLGMQNLSDHPVDPSTGAAGTSDGPFYVESEVMRLRVGYSKGFGARKRIAVTPFLGLSQQAWLRGSTGLSGTTAYLDYTAEVGLLAQAGVTSQIVVGADASIGHTLATWQIDQRNLVGPHGAVTSAFSLYFDNRTSADWHQRLILRKSFARYGEPADSVGSLEPRRNSAFSVQLEFGTELDLFESLFH